MYTPLRFAVLLCGLSAAAAVYPMSFAFENEIYRPPDPEAGNPNFSYDPDTDPGGYLHYGAWTMKLFPNGPTDADMPWTPHKTFHTSYLLVITYAFTPVNPLAFWNCSLTGNIFTSADFLGVIDNKKICEVGSCCSNFYDKPAFSPDALQWHTTNSEKNSAGLCPVMEEEAYCMEIIGHSNENCLEYFVAPDQLLTNIICVDIIARFYLKCPVFKTAISTRWKMDGYEPMTYLEQNTNEQIIVIDSLVVYGEERICSPHSYYHPEDVKGSDGGSPKGSSGGPVADDSAAPFIVLSSLFTLLLL